eukprot:gene14763-biopygen6222
MRDSQAKAACVGCPPIPIRLRTRWSVAEDGNCPAWHRQDSWQAVRGSADERSRGRQPPARMVSGRVRQRHAPATCMREMERSWSRGRQPPVEGP